MLLIAPETCFEEIYRIYEKSFPPAERRTKEGQKQVFSNPCYRIRVVEDEGEVLAFLGYWELSTCVFLEHLATAERCRGKGHGKQLVEEVIGESTKPVYLEIEPVTEENPITGRRAVFYERIGFHLNSFYYEQMPLKSGDMPIPLQIMSFGKAVAEEEFEVYKKEIYEVVYGVNGQIE